MELRAKSVRDLAGPDDGELVLVSRLRPRGVVADRIQVWERELAPSLKLDYSLWRGWLTPREHAALFVAELWRKAPRLRELGERAHRRTVTLLCPCNERALCRGELVVALVTRLFELRTAALTASAT